MDEKLLQPILDKINSLLSAKSCVLLAIEGGSCSGKTTLASLLQQHYDCNVFHMDDFFLRPEQRTPQRYAQPGGNVDHERFYEQVLRPLSLGEAVEYARFDCSSFSLMPPILIPSKPLNIIEGAYSMHPSLAACYDFSVFLRITPEIQRERILQRNGTAAQRFFDLWIPLENAYFSATNAARRCNMVVDISQSAR